MEGLPNLLPWLFWEKRRCSPLWAQFQVAPSTTKQPAALICCQTFMLVCANLFSCTKCSQHVAALLRLRDPLASTAFRREISGCKHLTATTSCPQRFKSWRQKERKRKHLRLRKKNKSQTKTLLILFFNVTYTRLYRRSDARIKTLHAAPTADAWRGWDQGVFLSAGIPKHSDPQVSGRVGSLRRSRTSTSCPQELTAIEQHW